MIMRASLLASALILSAGAASAVGPVVTSIVARQLADGTGRVSIAYSLADPDSATVYISVAISTNGESTYSARSYVTGDVGWVRPGRVKRVVWDAKADLGAGAVFANCKARIAADDSSDGVRPGEMIYIPAGAFLMGNNGAEPYSAANELPQHLVCLSGYWIGKYEVTRGEYRRFMDAGGYSNPAYWSGTGWTWKGSRTEPAYWAAAQDWGPAWAPQRFTQSDDHPVVGVSCYEAEAFCNWAGGHLPTEAQWEKAARWTGSYPNVYPWGNTWDRERCNNYDDTSLAGGGYGRRQTARVGSYPDGASPYGCHDMAGNVWEFCKDLYLDNYYSQTPVGGWSDPQGPTIGTYRVLRGGSWDSFHGVDLPNFKCAYRSYNNGNINTSGFRLAR